MNKNLDPVIRHAKEAATALTGNRRLKREGRVNQAKGSIKNAVDRAGDAINGLAKHGKQA